MTNTKETIPFDTIHDTIPVRFRNIAGRFGDKTALRSRGRQMTYARLDSLSDALAAVILESRGSGKCQVAFYLETGIMQIVALLGILKAGKTYVPLDVNFPAERNQYMVEDSQCSVVVTNSLNLSQARALAPDIPVINIDETDQERSLESVIDLSPDDLMMIIYTSGSTGKPKGVMHDHRNMIHFSKRLTDLGEITPEDIFAFYFSVSFSAHALPILGALLNGCTLTIFDLKGGDFTSFGEWMEEERVTATLMIPSVLRQFLATMEKGKKLKDLRLLFIGGETLYRSDIEKTWLHVRRTTTIINIYASTEAYVCRAYKIPFKSVIKGNIVPIGYAMEDMDMLITDEEGKEKDSNKIGEIRIRSPYVALGYWNNPELSARDFITDPDSSDERTFISSDMGYHLPDGCIIHMGRSDSMVKLRGYRIDLGEIENLMIQDEKVKETAVVLKENPFGSKHIVAYVVPAGKDPPDTEYLRIAVLRMLPNYMVPSHFVVIDRLPKNPIGKTIKKDLPEPDWNIRASRDDIVEPENTLQEELKEIFERILEVSPISIRDNILDLGADSLRLFVAFDEIEKHFGIKLDIDAIMKNPNIEHIGSYIEEKKN